MVVKSFKRTISLLLSLIFVLSCVPVVGMAEGNPSINLINFANVSNSGGRTDTVNPQAASGNDYTVKATKSGDWRAYAQFDFSGYEEILALSDASLTFSVQATGNYSTHKTHGFEIYLVNDSYENYDMSTIKYSNAGDLNDTSHYGEKIAENLDAEYYKTGTEIYTADISIDKIRNALKQGKDNSLITLAFVATVDNAFFTRGTGKLTFIYDEEKLNQSNYAQEIADEIKWEDLSEELRGAVTQNLTLPTELYGADISWTSSDDTVINSAGVVTQSYEKKNVTLTANVSYKGELSESAKTGSNEFTVTVPKLTYNYSTGNYETNPDGIYSGDDTSFVFISGANRSYITVTSVDSATVGKAAGDKVYSVHDLAGDTNFINYRFHPVYTADKNNDIMEFSIFVPEDTEHVCFEAEILNKNAFTSGSGSGQITIPYDIKSDGLYYYDSTKVCELKKNQWYNIAFVAPKGMATPGTESDSDDKLAKLYINGEFVHAMICDQSTSYGLRAFRFRGYDSALTDAGYYLDNMRLYSGDYVSDRDSVPVITSSYSIEENVINLPGNTTAAQLKASVKTDDYTVLRVYNSIDNMTSELPDETILSNGNILVAATTNDTNLEKGYSYYRIEKSDYTIDANILVNDAPSKSFGKSDTVSAEVVFNNYCAGTQNVTMYVAQYENDELINIWKDEKTVANGENKILSSAMTGFSAEENSGLKLILVSSDTLSPYISPVITKYRDDSETPSLYLIGDSIVQEYGEDIAPKQGWGKYIGDYLDGIEVKNMARSGWTTDNYLYPDGVYTKNNGLYEYGTELNSAVDASEKYKTWPTLAADIKPGDFVMVSLGINDSSSENPVPSDRYIENITTIYNEATQKGASVILSTPTISGRSWNDGYSFTENWSEYGNLCEGFSKTNDSVCLPLGETLVKTYNQTVFDYMDKEGVDYVTALNYTKNLYHLYSEGGWDVAEDDATHLNEEGANRIAKIISDLMRNSKSNISAYVK